MDIVWEQLHDSVLDCILIEWEKETIKISIKTAEYYFPEIIKASIIAENASLINCPIKRPWGRSLSINKVTKEGSKLMIEMQSGDTIFIEAEIFKLVKE